MTSASTMFLANIPSPDRGVWQLDLGFLTIPLRAYALCIIVGIIVAIWWGERRLIARGGEPGTVVDVAVWAVPFGLVGGRLYHVATDYYRYFGEGKHPLDALRIWDGGLGIWGAIALGGVGAWIGCRRRGVSLALFADAVAPGIVTAQAIGRVGNYFNQELYGGPTNLPWGLEIYQRFNEFGLEDPLNGVARDHTLIDNSPVHPTFLYELVWNLLVALLVVVADRKFRLGHGRAFALYVAGYTVGRGAIEMMRTDPATLVLGLRINVFTSAILFLGAVAYILIMRKKGPRVDPSTVDPATVAPVEAAPVDKAPEPDDTDADVLDPAPEDHEVTPEDVATTAAAAELVKAAVAAGKAPEAAAEAEATEADTAEPDTAEAEESAAESEDAVATAEPETAEPETAVEPEAVAETEEAVEVETAKAEPDADSADKAETDAEPSDAEQAEPEQAEAGKAEAGKSEGNGRVTEPAATGKDADRG